MQETISHCLMRETLDLILVTVFIRVVNNAALESVLDCKEIQEMSALFW